MPKVKGKKRFAGKHEPLGVQIQKDIDLSANAAGRRAAQKLIKVDGANPEDTCGHGDLAKDHEGFAIPNDLSRKILKQARAQREEEMMDEDAEEGGGIAADAYETGSEATLDYDTESTVPTETPVEDHEDFELDEEEERLLGQFAPQSKVQSRNLADIIMGKIREKEKDADDAQSKASKTTGRTTVNVFDARIIKVYKTIGKLFRRYTAGRIPKAFKVLPHLQGWEDLLWLTSPQDWTPHALYAATRVFAHASNETMCQRFYNIVLLPSVRHKVRATGKLHSHQFMAIRKSLWKPGAFNKGFLLPLAAEPDLSLREALIVASALQRVSMPRAHAMVALLKIAQLPYNGSSSLFIRVLLDKKYDMPYQVVDALVKHFHAFVKDSREFPVIWHQCLLAFVQRYKADLFDEQIALIKKVINKHNHPMIGSEIRREFILLENERKRSGAAPRSGAK
eukprot:Hpha_TRINITY_DN15894_c0_g2::TRINITY_DN15894_c0_g2_i1::g.189153::m.189153/K14797/ENP1, BYSL; essential nuclear protein 1